MYTCFGPPIVAISRPSRKKEMKGDVEKQTLALFYLSKFYFISWDILALRYFSILEKLWLKQRIG